MRSQALPGAQRRGEFCGKQRDGAAKLGWISCVPDAGIAFVFNEMAASHCLFCSQCLQRQTLAYFLANPHYGSIIYADGHGEVWTDWNNMSKFFQYGWRCTTNENSYSNRTLMGNWNQERYDLKNIVQPKPLPSQFGHYFETTYDASYNNHMPLSTHRFKREPHCFPGHQPELDPPQYKCTEKSTYMRSYSKPQTAYHSGCRGDPNVHQFQAPGF